MNSLECISVQSASAAAQTTPIVFVVDDDISVREGLHSLIGTMGCRVMSSASAEDFLAGSRPTAPSCLLLDMTLPGLNGLDLQGLLADRHDMPIIFMSGYGDVRSTVRAMKAGAVEFLIKPFPDDVVLIAIQQALERSRLAISERVEQRRLEIHYNSLSARERQVMRLVAAGKLNKQISCELSISEITVKAHRGRVMRKMAAKSLAHLVRLAGRLGIDRPS